MAVRAHVGIDVKIIEQDEFARELVVVRRDAFAEQDQRRIAVTFLHIAQNLIVRPIFLHDVDDVLDGRGRSRPVRDGAGAGDSGIIQTRVAIR